ncbi:MAG: hypothetical protein Q8R13_03765 [bacterium]|nr:hypothetical protein [bacterium]
MLKVDGQTLAVNFRTAAEKFKLIQDEDSMPVIVRYCGPDGNDKTIDEWLNALKKDGPERWLMRKLQRYTVTIPRRDAMRLLAQNDVEEVILGLFAQANDLLYSNQLGFIIDRFLPPAMDSSNTVPMWK